MRVALLYGMFLCAAAAAREPEQAEGGLGAAFSRKFLGSEAVLQSKSDLRFAVPLAVMEAYFREQMFAALPRPSAAPVDAVLSRWQARVDLSAAEPRADVAMAASVFRASPSRPVRVWLFPVSTVFEDLVCNGRAVDPLADRDWFFLPLYRPGPAEISVTLHPRVLGDGSENSLRLAKRGFVVGSVDIAAAESVEARVEGVPFVAVGRRIRLAAGAADEVLLRWRVHERAAARTGQPSVIVSAVWTVGEKRLTVRGLADVTALGGALRSVRMMLPAGAERAKITGPLVGESRPDERGLEAFFRGALRGRTRLRFSFSTPRGAGSEVVLPALGFSGAHTGEGGWLLVANDAGGELLEQQRSGLSPVAAVEVPSAVRGLSPTAPAYCYRKTARRGRATFDLVATTPFPVVDTIADRADLVTVLRGGGEEMTRVTYSLRNNRAQFLRVSLPAEANLLTVRVDEKPCRPARTGNLLLIPLVRSIQTLSGLVSFPVELVYCRRGDPLEAGRSRVVELPELTDVPAALVNAAVFCPESLRWGDTRANLQRVEAFTVPGDDGFTYGYGYRAATPAASGSQTQRTGTRPEQTRFLADLARHYYRAGYEAYQRRELEAAEEFLKQATTLVPQSATGANASGLLGNIRAGRGHADAPSGRRQRAKVAAIQRSLTAENVFLEAEQEELIEAGLGMLRAGDEKLGVELLSEAENVGRELTQRSASIRGQQVRAERYRHQLEQARRRQEEDRKLEARLATLREEVIGLARGGEKAQGPQRQLGRALVEAAESESIPLSELQKVAFGDLPATADADDNGQADVAGSFYAKDLRRSRRGQSVKGLPLPGRLQVPGRLFAAGNVHRPKEPPQSSEALRQRIDVLEEVIERTRAADVDGPAGGDVPAPVLKPSQSREVRKRVAEVRERVRTLNNAAAPQPAWQFPQTVGAGSQKVYFAPGGTDSGDMRRTLTNLYEWAELQINLFGTKDLQAQKELQSLRSDVARAAQSAAAAEQARQTADAVVLDASGVVDATSQSDRVALERLLSYNYLPRLRNNEVQFTVEGELLSVLNAASNVVVVGDVLENLGRNDGLAVPVAGRVLQNPLKAGNDALARFFTGRLADGRRFAVMDEAQYRTFVAAAMNMGLAAGGPEGGLLQTEQRDVIVGTRNCAAAENFRLARTAGEYNDLALGDTTIQLPVDRYLVVDNGRLVSVIKAGEARDWRDPAKSLLDLGPRAAYKVDLPLIGRPAYFEKTLLAAGESLDLEVVFE